MQVLRRALEGDPGAEWRALARRLVSAVDGERLVAALLAHSYAAVEGMPIVGAPQPAAPISEHGGAARPAASEPRERDEGSRPAIATSTGTGIATARASAGGIRARAIAGVRAIAIARASVIAIGERGRGPGPGPGAAESRGRASARGRSGRATTAPDAATNGARRRRCATISRRPSASSGRSGARSARRPRARGGQPPAERRAGDGAGEGAPATAPSASSRRHAGVRRRRLRRATWRAST